eukprot:10945166-Lingulodinium_polyedra.AAC.1
MLQCIGAIAWRKRRRGLLLGRHIEPKWLWNGALGGDGDGDDGGVARTRDIVCSSIGCFLMHG